MKVDIKTLVKKVRGAETKRGQISLYADKALFKRFKQVCEKEEVPASRVLEEFMREFIEDAKAPKKR